MYFATTAKGLCFHKRTVLNSLIGIGKKIITIFTQTYGCFMFFNTKQFDHAKNHLFFFIDFFYMIHSILGGRISKKAPETFF